MQEYYEALEQLNREKGDRRRLVTGMHGNSAQHAVATVLPEPLSHYAAVMRMKLLPTSALKPERGAIAADGGGGD